MNTTKKICKKCGRILPIENFYKHPKMGDGHLSFCKDCVRERVRAHREKNLEKIRAYDRRRGKEPKRKKHNAEEMKKRNQEVQGYRAAHSALTRAVRNGTVYKPGACQVCGKKCRTEAHHKDYTDKLNVVWLCRQCHSQYHQGKTERARAIQKAVDNMFRVKEIDASRSAS